MNIRTDSAALELMAGFGVSAARAYLQSKGLKEGGPVTFDFIELCDFAGKNAYAGFLSGLSASSDGTAALSDFVTN